MGSLSTNSLLHWDVHIYWSYLCSWWWLKVVRFVFAYSSISENLLGFNYFATCERQIRLPWSPGRHLDYFVNNWSILFWFLGFYHLNFSCFFLQIKFMWWLKHESWRQLTDILVRIMIIRPLIWIFALFSWKCMLYFSIKKLLKHKNTHIRLQLKCNMSHRLIIDTNIYLNFVATQTNIINRIPIRLKTAICEANAVAQACEWTLIKKIINYAKSKKIVHFIFPRANLSMYIIFYIILLLWKLLNFQTIRHNSITCLT